MANPESYLPPAGSTQLNNVRADTIALLGVGRNLRDGNQGVHGLHATSSVIDFPDTLL